MSCFNITKYGFTTIDRILNDIISEMSGNVSVANSGSGSSGPLTLGGDPRVTSPYHASSSNAAKGNVAINSGVSRKQYFDIVYDSDGTGTHVAPTAGAGTASTRVVILSSNVAVDPLAYKDQVGSYYTAAGNSSNWRICFNVLSATQMAVHIATEIQLQNDGTIAQYSNRTLAGQTPTPALIEPVGNVSPQDWTAATPGTGAAAFNKIWLDRDASIAGSEAAYPMSYTLTMTNRGMFLAIWEGSQEETPEGTWDTINNPNPNAPYGYSPLRWILAQRSVDRITGHVRGGATFRGIVNGNPANNAITQETSRCPLFVVAGSSAPQQFVKFIAREVDVPVPSRKRPATIQSEDNPAILNPYPQQSLTESGEFVVTFLNNLSSPRFRYADELDMLGTVSAAVVGAGTTITVDVYNENQGGYDNTGNLVVSGSSLGKRRYTALYGTERYGTGMRLMVLTAMGWNESTATNSYNDSAENSHI